MTEVTEVSVGRKAPAFELPDEQNQPWNLSGNLEAGPVMLVFYRGDWCPYCNGQLVSFARKFGEFGARGAQVAAVSVDPPDHNLAMVRKLALPFPLLSDARGELARRYGLWDAGEGVAMPAIVVVDRTGEVRYLYAGADFADRPGDGEILAALDDLDGTEKHGMEGPEIRLSAAEARDSVRPDKPPVLLEDLVHYYRGAFFATVALKKRFDAWKIMGRDASREVGGYQDMVSEYAKAVEQTLELRADR